MKQLLIRTPRTWTKLASVVLMSTAALLSGCAQTQKATSVDTGSFKVPGYEHYQLANGLNVYLMPQKEVPLITVNAVVRAGAVNDTTAGVASMTAQGLLLGANGKTKSDIEQMVDFLGASIQADAGKEGSYVGADFMAKDVDKMLPLVRDLLVSPDFDAAEFDKLRQREMAGLAQAKESPRNVIGRYFDKLVFGQHPYGNPSSGTRSSLEEMTNSQLRAFHKSFYQPNNSSISIVGDFDSGQMKAKLEQLFAGWKNSEEIQGLALDKEQPELSRSRVLLVNKGDAIETTFLIGGKGIARDNPDYVGLQVVNTILGGRFTSWLNDELRVNAGLTYGARSGFSAYSQGGVFRISTFTKSDTTKEAIDLALKTYGRLFEKGIDQATLNSAKAYVKGQFPPKFETNGQLAELLSDMYLYGFDDSFINNFQSQVDGLTLADTQRLISSYFPKDNLQYVLIGNAAKIGDIAAQYGEVKQVEIEAVGFGQ
ncbi:pitrilysin family protein [Shewanella sp. Isolate11]|uniref:M16 family metallopeptidase n=1 Tax=Shewanella sp. Isolate11 TaxID=2908530 RepID=UPI001EFD4F96|nr:pitrilysin family protein [Shewanella sp. Isolate11]MCG9697878.1 insulinase family protein [Shewanella sp. Isolate11]